MSNRSPHFFVLSSPSGGGKTTLLKRLLAGRSDLRLSVSFTIRPPRSNELEGQDYHFISSEAFQKKVDAGAFLEWEEVHGFRYGTPKAELSGSASDLVFDVDTKGALNLKRLYPATTLIFIQPPSLDVLRERLQARGTEDAAELEIRLQRFQTEVAEKDKFDYVIVNDEVGRAAQELEEIIVKVQQNV